MNRLDLAVNCLLGSAWCLMTSAILLGHKLLSTGVLA